MARSLTCVGVRDRLDAYLAQSLGRGERASVDRHLADCADCRRELAFLTTLLADARGLPRTLDPERDLWPEIAERFDLAEGRGSRRWHWTPLAAAAVVLVALAAALVVNTLVRRAPSEPVAAATPQSAGVVLAGLEAEYAEATAELEAALEAGRDVLKPETVAVIEGSLRVIDEAIAEAQAALAADPANAELVRRVGAGYALKVDLLRRAARLAAEI